MKTRQNAFRKLGSKFLACVLAGTLGAAPLMPISAAWAQQPPSQPTAPQDPKLEQARQHFGAGYQKFTANNYAGALVDFTAADNLVPAGATAYYIGQCQEKLNRPKEALAAYARFVADPGDKPQMQQAAQGLTPKLAELRAKLPAAQLEQIRKAAYDDGVKKYQAGNYQGALDAFKTSDLIQPNPQNTKYTGQAYDHLGKMMDAVQAYQAFLSNVPKGMEKDADDVKARVAQIMAMPGKVHVETTPPGASVAIDGAPSPGTTPTDLSVAPGHHKLTFSMTGHASKDVDVDVGFASEQTVPTQALPEQGPPPGPIAAAPPPATTTTAAPPVQTPPPAQPRSKLPAYITGGLAVAAAGVGTVFGIIALGKKSDYDSNPTASTADDGENAALIADMAFFVAVTLGVTSAVLFFTKDEPAASTAQANEPAKKPSGIRLSAAPIVTPHGGGAGALIQF